MLAGVLAIVGCATPGPPQPPSLHLPDQVNDLAAVRSGNAVALAWTMPRRNTDREVLKRSVPVHICRVEGAGGCISIGNISAEPGGSGAFNETLPDALTTGEPRPLRYFAELRNHAGRSAGLSNAAMVLAGQAPPRVENFAADVRKSGIALHWQAATPAVTIRLRRTLLDAAQQKSSGRPGILAPEPEAAKQTLLVAGDPGIALDRAITFGHTYEYRAQRVARIESEGHTVELAGELSAPVRVEAADIFPPAVPTGLVAVATLAEPGQPGSPAEGSPAEGSPAEGSPAEGSPAEGSPAIDLSWQPSPDADMAGYIVYRRVSDGAWQRISGAQPVPAPAYHDAAVQAGQTYNYAVTAVGRSGHESARSEPASETVPNP
jgi:hypothetical protein